MIVSEGLTAPAAGHRLHHFVMKRSERPLWLRHQVGRFAENSQFAKALCDEARPSAVMRPRVTWHRRCYAQRDEQRSCAACMAQHAAAVVLGDRERAAMISAIFAF